MTARRVCALLLLAAPPLSPASASAHAGPISPVATNFAARITSLPPGLEARVVDGDQQLSLRAPAGETVVVLGFSGEPYLRFSRRGVEINERSPAAYLNRARPIAVPATADPRSKPQWRRIKPGHVYRWHEDRLHALALTVRSPHSRYVGPWTIPLRIHGRPRRISGALWYAPPPTRLWFWPIVVVLVCLAGLLRLRRPRLDTVLAAGLTVTALAGIVIAHAGRNLYGRPSISTSQVAWLAFACWFALVALALLFRSRWRAVATLATAGYALAEGLSLLATLTKGNVLTALPAPLQRVAALATLAAGAGALLVIVAGNPYARPGRFDRRGAAPPNR